MLFRIASVRLWVGSGCCSIAFPKRRVHCKAVLVITFRIRPQPNNQFSDKFGRGFASVIIDTDDEIVAVRRAVSYLLREGFEITERPSRPTKLQPPPAGPQFDGLRALYKLAESAGISCRLGMVAREADNPEPMS